MLSQTKSILAKLLATENLRVEHRKVQTAYFDLKSRTLICPIWKDMSSDLYDLLMAHEVGHALHTPEQGWHNEVKDCTAGFKTYLNVIEDARIERKMKQKYPGLKPSFSKAYQELVHKEFFGPSYIIESEHLPLIDRINLHYKIGSYANIRFERHEKKFLETIDTTETWEDVVSIAKKLFEYGKTEKKELQDLLSSKYDNLEYSDYEDFDNDEDGDSVENRERMDFDDDTDEDLDQTALEEILDKSGTIGDGGKEEPQSVTDKFFREKEASFLDPKCRPYLYADIPTAYLDNIVVPYKKILNTFDFTSCTYEQHCSVTPDNAAEYKEVFEKQAIESRDLLYKKFLDTNKKYISYLIKEFELKRNAKQYARASVSKTGELDVKKAFSYKFNEDIFKRVTVVPKGKSHGLLMFVDFSGSMEINMKATIEQTLLLAMFCRKVNIPFRVLAFSDNSDGHEKWIGKVFEYTFGDLRNFTFSKFSHKPNEFGLYDSCFYLAEYLSSEMSSAEFTQMSKDLLYLAEAFSNNQRNNWRYDNEITFISYNKIHSLNGTPLESAIVAGIEVTKQFKKGYKLDIVNTIFLTDGEGHSCNRVFGEVVEREMQNRMSGELEKYNLVDTSYLNYLDDSNLVFTDRSTMTQGLKRAGEKSVSGLLNVLSGVTGANIVGFYLMYKPSVRQISGYAHHSSGKPLDEIESREVQKSFRTYKYAAITIPGYKKFFILPAGKELEIEEDTLEVEQNANKNDLRKAFMKMQKNKLVNRVFLNKFIEQIA